MRNKNNGGLRDERRKREIDLKYYMPTHREKSTHLSWRSLTDRLIASHTYRGEKHLRGRLPLAEMLRGGSKGNTR